MRREEFGEMKKAIEERLQQFYSNFTEVYGRVRSSEELEARMVRDIEVLLRDDQEAQAELKRINTVLVNLKIGEDFQKMLEEMDPSKVL